MWYLGGPLEFYRIDPIMEIKFPGENCLRKQFSMKSRNFSKSRFPGKKAAVGFVKQLKISGPEFPVNATGRCYRNSITFYNRIKYNIGAWLWSSWRSSRFRHQRSVVRIQTSAKFFENICVYLSIAIQKRRIKKKKRPGLARLKKTSIAA